MRKIALSTFFAVSFTAIFWHVWSWFKYIPQIDTAIWSVVRPSAGVIQINFVKYSEGLSRSTDIIGVLILGLIITASHYTVFNRPANEMEMIGIKNDYKTWGGIGVFIGAIVSGLILFCAIQGDKTLVVAVCCAAIATPILFLAGLMLRSMNSIERSALISFATWFTVGHAVFWGVLYGFLPVAILTLAYLLTVSGAIIVFAML